MSTGKVPAVSGAAVKIPSKITMTCTLPQLRAEATFRGLDLGTVPLSKVQLLGILGDGSTSSRAAAEKAAAVSQATAAGKKTSSGSSAPKYKKVTAGKQATTSGDEKRAVTTTGSAAPAKKKEATASKKPSAAEAKSSACAAPAKTKTTAVEKSAPAKKKEASVERKSSAAPVATLDTKKTGNSSTSPAKMKNLAKPSPSKQMKLSSMLILKKGPSETSAIKAASSSGSNKKRKDDALDTNEIKSRKKMKAEPCLSSSSSHTSGAPAVGPPPAKQTAAAQQPRISKKLSLAELRVEVDARGLQNTKKLPKTKADLLDFLVDGSIHVAESGEYKQYQSLLNRLEEERPQLYQQSLVIRETERQKAELRRQKQVDKDRLAFEAARTSEIQAQTSLHRHSFPRVHPHSLASTAELFLHGNPRSRTSGCDLCGRQGVYTCEQCDWDVCVRCFEHHNLTPEKRLEKEKKERIEYEKRRREEEKREAKAEREAKRRWDAAKQFAAGIIKPSISNKALDAKDHKYIVWCSDEDPYDPPAVQEFDTGWKTTKEANDRARYLFFWKNPWGTDPCDLSDANGEVEPNFLEGLVSYTVQPDDSSCWTVGVVPAVAFRHLPQAMMSRHNFDDEGTSQRESCDYEIQDDGIEGTSQRGSCDYEIFI